MRVSQALHLKLIVASLLLGIPLVVTGGYLFFLFFFVLSFQIPFTDQASSLLASLILLSLLFFFSCWFQVRYRAKSFRKHFDATRGELSRFLGEGLELLWRIKHQKRMFQYLIITCFLLVLSLTVFSFLTFTSNEGFVISPSVNNNFPIKIDSSAFVTGFIVVLLILVVIYFMVSKDFMLKEMVFLIENKRIVLKIFFELAVSLSIVSSGFVSLSLLPSSITFLVSTIQFVPIFLFLYLLLLGVLVGLVVFSVLLGWSSFVILLGNGLIIEALMIFCIYAFLLLNLLVYYRTVFLNRKVTTYYLRRFEGNLEGAVSPLVLDEIFKNREIDNLLQLATTRGWANWKNYPWLKIKVKEIRARALKTHPLDFDEFVFFSNNSLLHLPTLASLGVIDLVVLSKRMGLDVPVLEAMLRKRWGSNAVFLSPRIVIHKDQLTLAESFSLEELEALNIDEINIKSLRMVVSSLENHGFLNNSIKLQKLEPVSSEVEFLDFERVESSSDRNGLDKEVLEGKLADLKKRRDWEAILRLSISLANSFEKENALEKFQDTPDHIIHAGYILLEEGEVEESFHWFVEHECWDQALEVGEILLRKQLAISLEKNDVQNLIEMMRTLFDVFLKSNKIEHIILQDMALVLAHLKFTGKFGDEEVNKEVLALTYEEIYNKAPSLFPVEWILMKIGHLYSEAGNREKAIAIWHLLANRITGAAKQQIYTLIENEMMKESGHYRCIFDMKRYQYGEKKRKICRNCKHSLCIECFDQLVNSVVEGVLKCPHCDNPFWNVEKSERVMVVPYLSSHVEILLSYIKKNLFPDE